MSDMFYRAIKAQDYLDTFYPERHWPIGYAKPPSENTIKIANMYGTGSSIEEIMKSLNVSKVSVMSVIRRCRRYTEKGNTL